MSNIVLYNKNKTSLGVVEFMRDTGSQIRIRDINDSYSLKKEVAHFIAEQAAHVNMKDPVSNLVKREIAEMISSRFKNLSFDEMYYAFKLERYGVYEEKTEHYGRISVDYVSAVMNKYVEYKQKIKRDYNISTQKSLPAPSISEEEKQRLVNQAVVNMFMYFQEHSVCDPDRVTNVYNILYDMGYLPTDKEYKRKKYADAQVLCISNETAILPQYRVRSVAKAIEDFKKERNPEVISKAKELVLSEFFRKMFRDENSLNEFKVKFKIENYGNNKDASSGND